MFILGVTGGIGTGKTTVASLLRSVGVQVIDADRIAHELTNTKGEIPERIAAALGDDTIREDGSLDRQRVAELAFTNKRVLDTLSAIVHEEVVRAMDAQIEEAQRKKIKVIALDVPIPVNRGFLDVADEIWAISADDDTRILRLLKRGMDEKEAKRRIAVQMTREEYRDLAHVEIENNGSLIDLEEKVFSRLREALSERGIQLPALPRSIS
ncbi:MAG: dephospho-CoA kinase [Clostridiales bacterium]|jgi:dephospho-CoA kinase|nr:dephospho-CoA kinase [Clostridiales bacterium]MDD2572366.1 dephospho-CoA kinase [Eubacteriales bacterium]MDY0119580.1 dephospho-CoA kinase [Clostridia bacterium]NLG30472.1 dephospho-CoA kinase [Clostridiaceae bacterium]MCK9350182.1 dephospho-CoA kinase [Clostridiales bacterium]